MQSVQEQLEDRITAYHERIDVKARQYNDHMISLQEYSIKYKYLMDLIRKTENSLVKLKSKSKHK